MRKGKLQYRNNDQSKRNGNAGSFDQSFFIISVNVILFDPKYKRPCSNKNRSRNKKTERFDD